MKLAIRRAPSGMQRTDVGHAVRGLRIRGDVQAVQQALARHIDAAPFLHAGMVNEDCPACREMVRRLK
jgi:hypothetical protein